MKSKAAIFNVLEDSIASDLGWREGDVILSINGETPQDILDYMFLTADSNLLIGLKKNDGVYEYDIEKNMDEPLGVEFADVLFDGIHTCGAKCAFCFVEQLPRGLRRSLYIKDDDYRLSFLDGNYVTLANITQTEMDRIARQRLSPLYISVHCTDDEIRQRLLGRSAPSIMKQLEFLSQAHISFHTQIVLCPGINDGSVLHQTIEDLIGLYPSVESIAVVPVGLTEHRGSLCALKPVDAQKAEEIIDVVKSYQIRCKKEFASRIVWAADEFYILAGRRVPGNSTYEGYPQYENGVGIVRQFLNGLPAAKRMLKRAIKHPIRASVLTGKSAVGILSKWASDTGSDNLELDIIPIDNNTFGKSITVTGLICGRDIIQQVGAGDIGDVVLLPSVAVRGGVFLDDVRVDELSEYLRRPVKVVEPNPQDAARAIMEACS